MTEGTFITLHTKYAGDALIDPDQILRIEPSANPEKGASYLLLRGLSYLYVTETFEEITKLIKGDPKQ